MVIGRDLIRLLQSVARLQEFESLWRDIMLNPSTLAPHFTGIQNKVTAVTDFSFLHDLKKKKQKKKRSKKKKPICVK